MYFSAYDATHVALPQQLEVNLLRAGTALVQTTTDHTRVRMSIIDTQ